MFNDPANNAELRMRTTHVVTAHESPAPSVAGQAPGTLSQLREWWGYDQARERSVFIGLFHAYLRPDGTLGGSGKEDPKILSLGGFTYIDP